MTHPQRHKLTVPPAAIGLFVVVAAALLALGGLAIYFSAGSRSAARQVSRGTDIQACRSEYASRVTTATTNVNLLILEGLAAAALGDDDALSRLAQPGPGGNPSPAQTAGREVTEATGAYRRAVALSRSNPDRLLAECRNLTQGD